MIRVVLPTPLKTLAHVEGEVQLQVEAASRFGSHSSLGDSI